MDSMDALSTKDLDGNEWVRWQQTDGNDTTDP
jgi:hypothetical protein